jgi:hypothetical protein
LERAGGARVLKGKTITAPAGCGVAEVSDQIVVADLVLHQLLGMIDFVEETAADRRFWQIFTPRWV